MSKTQTVSIKDLKTALRDVQSVLVDESDDQKYYFQIQVAYGAWRELSKTQLQTILNKLHEGFALLDETHPVGCQVNQGVENDAEKIFFEKIQAKSDVRAKLAAPNAAQIEKVTAAAAAPKA